ncbi:MAG TPA: hypothetical protein VD994_07520 [Prosthecobacter sp.]|nr:hypothetical protein [Prosthecobacter sp.]
MKWQIALVLMLAGTGWAQVIDESAIAEAERRLNERRAVREAAATQPANQATVNKLLAQIDKLERELQAVRAENDKLRKGLVFEETKPVGAVVKGRLAGISIAGGLVDRIPARMMSKKYEDETQLDKDLRRQWIDDNLPGYGVTINKATVLNLGVSAAGITIEAEGYENGKFPSSFTITGTIPTEAKSRVLDVNKDDEVSLVGTVKSFRLQRHKVRLPEWDKAWPGVVVSMELADVKILRATRKPKKVED